MCHNIYWYQTSATCVQDKMRSYIVLSRKAGNRCLCSTRISFAWGRLHPNWKIQALRSLVTILYVIHVYVLSAGLTYAHIVKHVIHTMFQLHLEGLKGMPAQSAWLDSLHVIPPFLTCLGLINTESHALQAPNGSQATVMKEA